MLIKTFRSFNTEWFREPFSALESSLRFPHLVKEGLLVFARRVGLYWLLSGWIIGQLTGNCLVGIILGLLISVAVEFLVLKFFYRKALKRHLRIIGEVEKIVKSKERLSAKELAISIEEIVISLTKGSLEIGYVGFASWGWELLFRAIYPLAVKTGKVPYHLLLIGFENKTTEMDMALWRVANKNESLDKFLDKYGNRYQDVELSLPTLREQPKVIDQLVRLNKKMPNPSLKIKQAKIKRQKAEKEVMLDLRIPKRIFLWFLRQTQENVGLRENRRFWSFYGDYYIRQMIFELSKRLKISKKQVFDKTWKEIKNEVD